MRVIKKYFRALTMNPAFKREGHGFKPVVRVEDRLREWIIWKGDTVYIRGGTDKGKLGEVTKVERATNRIYVRGINVKQKEMQYPWQDKPTKVDVEDPINVSLVSLLDPVEKKPCKFKIAYTELKDGSFRKTRISELSGKELPFPKPPPRERVETKRDTPPDVVNEVTFRPDLSQPPIPNDCQLR